MDMVLQQRAITICLASSNTSLKYFSRVSRVSYLKRVEEVRKCAFNPIFIVI